MYVIWGKHYRFSKVNNLTVNNHFNAAEVNLSTGFNAALTSVLPLICLPDPLDFEMVVIQNPETDCRAE